MPQTGQTSTTFSIDSEEQLVFARNHDWNIGDGLVIVNKRYVSKTAMPSYADEGEEAPQA